MSWLDGLFVVITALFLYRGFQLGLIRSIFRYLAILAGLVAIIYGKDLGKAQLQHYWPELPSSLALGLSITLLFLFGLILTQFLGFILAKILSPTPLGPIDRIFGALFGSVKSVFIFTLAFYLFSLLPPLVLKRLHISNSLLYSKSQKFIPLIESKVRSIQSKSKYKKLKFDTPKQWVNKINSASNPPASSTR